MSNRTIRVNELVQRELSDILHRHFQTEAVTITITDVKVSPDLHDARVFINVIGDADTAEKKLRWLRTKAVEIRQELGRRIVLKFLPKFEYVLDQGAIRGERTRQLIDELGPMTPDEPEKKPEPEKAP
ncbi:MAG: 30S ribosome-binding factor RbfA [Verrucomicrobia bacterium]|nr:30S ribosome-binding factor RbfA [Verrucomicrobiota bacterium]